MKQSTGYQYAKLGSNLEYLRGICSVSLTPTASLKEFPDLRENVPTQRYLVANVVEVLRSLLVQVQQMNLPASQVAAQGLIPMLKEMEEFLGLSESSRAVFLDDAFAQRLVVLAKQVILAARHDLSGTVLLPTTHEPQ
jgi:hypothetical protein